MFFWTQPTAKRSVRSSCPPLLCQTIDLLLQVVIRNWTPMDPVDSQIWKLPKVDGYLDTPLMVKPLLFIYCKESMVTVSICYNSRNWCSLPLSKPSHWGLVLSVRCSAEETCNKRWKERESLPPRVGPPPTNIAPVIHHSQCICFFMCNFDIANCYYCKGSHVFLQKVDNHSTRWNVNRNRRQSPGLCKEIPNLEELFKVQQ